MLLLCFFWDTARHSWSSQLLLNMSKSIEKNSHLVASYSENLYQSWVRKRVDGILEIMSHAFKHIIFSIRWFWHIPRFLRIDIHQTKVIKPIFTDSTVIATLQLFLVLLFATGILSKAICSTAATVESIFDIAFVSFLDSLFLFKAVFRYEFLQHLIAVGKMFREIRGCYCDFLEFLLVSLGEHVVF